MPTAEPLPDNIRRIAVLVSSVDSATARQLLLHLPTPIAKQVRTALQNLGPVSPRERQRILAEFHSTAAKQSPGTGVQAVANGPVAQPGSSQAAHATVGFDNGSSNRAAGYQTPVAAYSQVAPLATSHAPSLAQHSERTAYPAHYSDSPRSFAEQPVAPESIDLSLPSWARMDIRALSHFLRSERSTVIAVVINQLPPHTGVALLQQLPAAMHREVLQAIANLQDFDAEAMQAIEEHLSERLKDYELKISSEAKGTRRVAALLAAAPAELQETWSRFVHIAVDPTDEASTASAAMTPAVTPASLSAEVAPKQVVAPSAMEQAVTRAAQVEAALESHVVTTVDAGSTTRNAQPSNPAQANRPSQSNVPAQPLEDEAYILPFPGPGEPKPLSAVDRSLIQLEFEQILTLSTQQLAQILTATNSHTVLLALAGASPSFMKRFYSMLNKADAKALASRLSQIGPLRLREIDEAQRTISELAAKLIASRSTATRSTTSQSLRVAA